jgi:hypothetical protein
MADEKIEVQWIGTANQMVQVLDRLEAKFDKQEAQLQKLATTSSKAADGAANSFNKLEEELKQNEAALKRMTMGTSAFDAQKKKVDELRKSFSQAKGEVGGIGQQASGALSGAITKMGQLAAGMLSFQTIVTMVVAELDKVKTMRLDAASATRTVEQSLAAMAVNVGAENLGVARQMIQERAPELGVTQEGLANLIAGGMSGGAESIQESMDLAAKTLKLTAGDAQRAGPLMSGMLSLAATTGNRDFESVLGQLSQFQKAGRGEDMAMSVNNMSTALAAANVKGERISGLGAERTLELGGAISQLIQDPTMAVTGTTMRQFFSKMDSFVPKESATLDDGTKSTLSKDVIAQFGKLNTFDDRVEAMRQNPELAKQFLSNIEENQGKSAIREIVTGSERAMQMLSAAEAIVTDAETAKAEYGKLAEQIGQMTALSAAENRSVANIQSAEVGSERASAGQAIKIVEDTLAKVNLSGLDYDTSTQLANQQRLNDLTGKDQVRGSIELLEAAKEQRKIFGFIPGGGQVSQEDKALIDRQIRVLEQLEQRLAQQQAAPATQRQPPVAAPATRPKEAPLPAATAP